MAGFNGATANSPWMTAALDAYRDAQDVLQWGHGEFAVDDLDQYHIALRHRELLQWGHGEFAVDDLHRGASQGREQRHASMGPRRIRRG